MTSTNVDQQPGLLCPVSSEPVIKLLIRGLSPVEAPDPRKLDNVRCSTNLAECPKFQHIASIQDHQSCDLVHCHCDRGHTRIRHLGTSYT